MSTLEDLARQLEDFVDSRGPGHIVISRGDAEVLLPEIESLLALAELRPLDEYHEDYGPVLWWRLPVIEPPYVGSMLDDDFPDDVTHWSCLPIPRGAK